MISRQIYTYADITKIGEAPYWEDIKGFPIITVSADLRKGFVGRAEIDKTTGLFVRDNTVRACEFRRLSDLAIPGWSADETKFRQTIMLSQFLRMKLSAAKDDAERRWLVGCRRNIASILSAIIMLEEANITYTDLQFSNDRSVSLLLEAWEYLYSADPSIQDFHNNLAKLNSKEAWESLICSLYNISSFEGLIIHGFFYFTPLQQRIIDSIEKAGIKTVYLFHYDDRYPYANEIWETTYSEENGYLPKDRWIRTSTTEINPFGELLEGRTSSCERLTIKEQGSISEFIQYIKRAKESGRFIYSPSPKTANDMLRDFYPEEYGDRKLLSYPIGQFVSTMNELWDDDAERVILEEDSVIECFSSGWLSIDGISGKQYIEDVVDIMPFFSDCRTLDDWKDRVILLRQIKETVITPFMKEISSDEMESRWQAIMGNPLLNFSVFAIDDNKLDIILRLISQIIDMAEDLFAVGHIISIPEHISKLDAMLRKHEVSGDIYEEERDIVIEVFNRLSESGSFIAECSPADISSAINLFMSGKFNDYEVQSDRIGMVSPLHQIEAATLRHEKIHVCLCDVKNMPGANKNYIWPLTGKLIRECYSRTSNRLIQNLIWIMESTCLCNRFFMYSALAHHDVQLSWLSNSEEKKLAPSPYIKLLRDFAGARVSPPDTIGITYNIVEDLETGTKKIEEYEVRDMPTSVSKEAKMDYALCPMKYVLGYVVDYQPSFSSLFHQNYAVNGLIMAILSLMNSEEITPEEVYNNVIDLFPALRDAEKGQIRDYINPDESNFNDARYQGYSSLAGMEYTEERLKVRFPNKKIRDEALSAYSELLTPQGQNGMDLYKKRDYANIPPYMRKTPPCAFCQHQTYCRLAVFGGEQEDLYDK